MTAIDPVQTATDLELVIPWCEQGLTNFLARAEIPSNVRDAMTRLLTEAVTAISDPVLWPNLVNFINTLGTQAANLPATFTASTKAK